MDAFLTGSHAYGKPGSESDIDLVVLMSEEELVELRMILAKRDHDLTELTRSSPEAEGMDYADSGTTALRFGCLNLLVVTDEVAYHAWLRGTVALMEEAGHNKRTPVTRDRAVEVMQAAREFFRVGRTFAPPHTATTEEF